MTLQEKMLAYRAKHNLTQTELAFKVGVSLQTINCVENGVQKPSKLTQTKILMVIEGDEE